MGMQVNQKNVKIKEMRQWQLHPTHNVFRHPRSMSQHGILHRSRLMDDEKGDNGDGESEEKGRTTTENTQK